jgi:aminoglycoside phosphotransferase (APT) family kinase protein
VDAATLDIEQQEQLFGYLRATNRIGADEPPPRMQTLAGGVSNRTVLVERVTGESWVLKQALAKLRVKADWFSDPSRVHREALGLNWLEKLAPPGTITPLVFEDDRHHLIAMHAVPQPHENWKTMLLAGRIERGHVEQFAALLGAIHRRAAESPEPLREIFDDRSFFESLRLEPYYAYTAEQVPEAAEFLRSVIADTRARLLTLVHGDYSPKNILVSGDGRLVLLDHEVIHWGDPAFDLGFALTHLLSKAHHLRERRFVDAAQLFCEVYSATVGPVYWDANLQTMAARHMLACMLARVAGRSPLEYLDHAQRARQRDWTIRAMQSRVSLPVNDVIGAAAWTLVSS